jgi:hypothetical protein
VAREELLALILEEVHFSTFTLLHPPSRAPVRSW